MRCSQLMNLAHVSQEHHHRILGAIKQDDYLQASKLIEEHILTTIRRNSLIHSWILKY